MEQETNMGKFVVDTETGEVVKESNTPHDYNETISPPVSVVLKESPEKKRQFPLAVCILSCVCVALSVCVCFLAYQANGSRSEVEALAEEKANLENKISTLENEKSKLSQEKTNLEHEKEDLEKRFNDVGYKWIETMVELNKVGFIVSGSRYYHNYECTTYKSADKYWAHNIEYCESLGYSPCPTCW